MLKTSFLQHLQKKWEAKNFSQVCLILLTFTLTGTTVVLLRKTLFDILGFTAETSFWLKTLTYLLFIFPAYQILILVYGALLGQFTFFWKKEKRVLQYIGILQKDNISK